MLCKVGIIYSNWAMGFRLDMALLCFLPAGNCLRRVSCSSWHHCVSCRQETICEGFPIRLDAIVFLTGRKLFAKGFLFNMALLCFLPAGNYLRMVSCSSWHHCVSYRQETICEWFPVRRYAIVFLTGRKLFAKGFLLDMALLCFIAAGNFFAGRFLDSARNDMGGMATLCFLPTGNCSRKVSYSA